MARQIDFNSFEQLAKRNGIPASTLKSRLKAGRDKIDSLITKSFCQKVTLEQVLQVEKLGLSITRSALVLGISQSRLSEIIIKQKINWRGRREYITKRG